MAAAGQRRWQCQGVGGGASVDISSGSGGGSGGGRGGAAALALLGLCQGRAADALACAARSQPRAAGGGQRRLLRLAMAAQSSRVVWAATAGQH